jgi:sugar lactone lactonase YvrE
MGRFGLFILLCAAGFLPVGCGSQSPSTPSGGSSAGFTYPFSFTFGDTGSGSNGTFNTDIPGIAVGFGAIFVTDETYAAVDKFDMYGNYLGQNVYSPGADLGGMALDKNGDLYVANSSSGLVDEYDQNLNYLQSFSGTGTFVSPFDVKVDNNLNLYVTDLGSSAVYKDSPADLVLATSSGVPGGFNVPFQTGMGSNGSLYVADYLNARVVVLNSSLVYTGSFDGTSAGATPFTGPSGVVVDSQGTVIVSDDSNTIQKFTTSGAYLGKITTGSAPVTYDRPFYMATDSNNLLYVANLNTNQVLIFNPN